MSPDVVPKAVDPKAVDSKAVDPKAVDPSARTISRRRSHAAGLRTQRGLSLIGLLLVAVVIIVLAIVTLRVVPSVLEYLAIRNAVEAVAGSGTGDARELQSAFDRQAAVDDITSISGRDLIIEKLEGATVVSFAYEKRIRLGGPVSLIIDYHGSSQN